MIADRYRLGPLLGSGGMGGVYRAHDLELDEPVALKILRTVGPTSVELLRREVKLARRVTHPNVVRVHDLGMQADGTIFLTMELVEGASLRELLATGKPTVTAATALARQLCDGLEAAHDAGVIHGDLKPANVLVRSGPGLPHALIADFGISRAVGETRAGWVAGTPQYMAPEQRAGRGVDFRADLYALGAVLFEIFAGERLFPSPRAAEAGRVPVERVRAEVPAPLADVVLRLLEVDPLARPPSVAHVARAVARAACSAGLDGAAGEAEAPRPAPRLAVVPFRILGSEADQDLGIGLTDELIRVLSSLPRLEVYSAAATSSQPGDPRAVARALLADVVVHGAVQRSRDRVRVTAALVEVATGLGLWSDRFDCALEDVFELQERAAMRICESLRVKWMSVAHIQPVAPEVVDLYFRARRLVRDGMVAGADGAVAILERALARAPRFEPALALRAVACCRAMFLPSAARERRWDEECRLAVAAALEKAPNLAESHLAAAMDAAQRGEYGEAVAAIARALELAPTLPDAHDYLGRLLAEAGRNDEAFRHLDLARRLDPSTMGARFYIPRFHALRGDREAWERLCRQPGGGAQVFTATNLVVRATVWFGDREELRRCLERLDEVPVFREEAELLDLYGRYVLGERDAETIDAIFSEQVVPRLLSSRVLSNCHQMMAEAHATRGEVERAFRHLDRATSAAMIDIDWLEHCAALDPLRADPRFGAAARLVRERADAMWRI